MTLTFKENEEVGPDDPESDGYVDDVHTVDTLDFIQVGHSPLGDFMVGRTNDLLDGRS